GCGRGRLRRYRRRLRSSWLPPFRRSCGGYLGRGWERGHDPLQDVHGAGRIPGGTADEEAVDVGPGDQLGGVAGVDAAAVEDRGLVGQDRGGGAACAWLCG